MLNSLEIYYALNESGITLEAGNYEPAYASEHALGNDKFLYVKRNGEKAVFKSPLVIHPDTLSLREKIDKIDGLRCTWQKNHSNSYRRFPKDGELSKFGYDADVESVSALHELVALLNDSSTISAASSLFQKPKNKVPAAMSPLNQILFGPPGTGKTYSTTELAVKIADGEWYQNAADSYQGQALREVVKARYQELIDKQRIMFTTFHQSFAYEDFIEGIRATTDEGTGNLRYEVVDGIFKQLCLNARVKVHASTSQAISLDGRRIWKMSLGNTIEDGNDIYQECVDNNYILLGWGEDINFESCPNYDAVKSLINAKKGTAEVSSNYMGTAVNLFKNVMRNGDLVVISDGNHKFRAIAEITGDYQYLHNIERDDYHQLRSVKWLRTYTPSLPKEQLFLKSLSQMTLYELRDTSVDREKLAQLLAPVDASENQALPHVLIIDEINRGNIARIFGELITLLEADKRQGAEDARSLMLPYSKSPFSVPDNVYVIGTMNTADKSLIQMDLALRRRFSFVELLPRPEVLAGVSVFGVEVSAILRRINQRIEVLLDSEHMIGHAYFMPLIKIEDENTRQQVLALIFQEKILPLLREYFFDDYERIGWVLNDPTKLQEDRFIWLHRGEDAAAVTELFPKNIVTNLSDRRFRINQQAFSSAAAYQGIL